MNAPEHDEPRSPAPVRVSESQYDRLVTESVPVCLRCGAIGPSPGPCRGDDEGHALGTAPDAELSGVLVVDWRSEA